jgi:type IV secretion system protein VirB11
MSSPLASVALALTGLAGGEPSGPASAGSREYASALELIIRPLRPLLMRPDVMEICINRPAEVFLETGGGWQREAAAYADLDWCRRFARLVGNFSRQRIDETSPLLSASLPGGERVQIAIPPATSPGCVAVNIRRPSQEVWSVGELSRRGIFLRTRAARTGPEDVELELRGLLAGRQYEAFMRLAVRSRRNILVSGPTGSGKTTWTKALIREIPAHERLVTIEDAPELVLDFHPNHVRLFYSKDDQGLARVTPKQLLEATLRMKPDRILLAELRAEEAFDYLRNVNSGHPGSITSVHASSAVLAFEQLVLLVKQSEGGRQLARRDIRSLLRRLVDVVIQCGVEGHERYIKEIWYRPRGAVRASAQLVSGEERRC